jgi:hypothetical protein
MTVKRSGAEAGDKYLSFAVVDVACNRIVPGPTTMGSVKFRTIGVEDIQRAWLKSQLVDSKGLGGKIASGPLPNIWNDLAPICKVASGT